MRILEIIPQLSSGGAERFTVDLCNELIKHHQVRLIVLHSVEEGGFYFDEIDKTIEVVSLNKKRGLSPKIISKLDEEISKYKPDIVHSHLRALIYTAPLVKKYKTISFFHTVHNDAKKEAGDFLSRFIRKLVFKNNYIHPITISPESCRSFEEYYKVKAPMIPNGRDIPKLSSNFEKVSSEISKYKKTVGSRVIVNLARIMPVKRQNLIARICKKLSQEGYDFCMLMIGRKENQEMVTEIESLECPNVYMLGEIKNPIDYLVQADGFCLFSEYEGFPISLIEALGTSSIPICTPVGGIKDIVDDGDNGVLARDISEEACYQALKRFLELPISTINKIKNKALISYQPYSMDKCMRAYEKVFQIYKK